MYAKLFTRHILNGSRYDNNKKKQSLEKHYFKVIWKKLRVSKRFILIWYAKNIDHHHIQCKEKKSRLKAIFIVHYDYIMWLHRLSSSDKQDVCLVCWARLCYSHTHTCVCMCINVNVVSPEMKCAHFSFNYSTRFVYDAIERSIYGLSGRSMRFFLQFLFFSQSTVYHCTCFSRDNCSYLFHMIFWSFVW